MKSEKFIVALAIIAIFGSAKINFAEDNGNIVMPSCKGPIGKVDYGVPSAENGTIPPSKYVIDYYAPPTDWFPATEIGNYTLNTRIPDLYWLKYENAYTLALRIRPITLAQIEKNIEVGVQLVRHADRLKKFDPELEKKAICRKVGVTNLKVPADDFVELTFKMRSKSETPNPEVIVEASGIGKFSTANADAAKVKCADGFTQYSFKLKPRKGAVLSGVNIVLPPVAGYSPNDCYEFFDFHFKRSAPKARFTDLPQRNWIRQSAFESGKNITSKDWIHDVSAYVRSNAKDIESRDIPFNYVLRPQQKEKDFDSGFTTEETEVDINGKKTRALKITLVNGNRCYLKFPIEFNAKEFNTITFYSKIDLPDGLPPKKLYGDDVPALYGTDRITLNSFFDTFSFGVVANKRDPYDWNSRGIGQGLSAYHRQRDAKTPAGWQSVALDLLNSDPAGNKGTFLPATTHFCFFYANSKIPEGAKVTITIADPKITKGLMLGGGELDKYRRFLADREAGAFAQKGFGKPFNAKTDKYLQSPTEGRLDKPLPFIRDHIPAFEVILPDQRHDSPREYLCVINRALKYMEDFLRNKYGLVSSIPVLRKASTNDNVKLFLGSSYYAAVDKKQVEEDKKKFLGNPGCAIRTRGKNVYIYGGLNNYAKETRGIVNGIYVLLENNTDEIMVQRRLDRRTYKAISIFEFDKTGNMDLVWGKDYINAPLLQYWSMAGSKENSDRNMSVPDDWGLGQWNYAGRRQHTTNHFWGYGAGPYGAKDPPNERWGLGEHGKRIRPGCYSSHPCLINVLENAKVKYLEKAYRKLDKNDQAPRGDYKSYVWYQQDTFGLWVEDTLRVCVCDKCTTPIRLADGSLVKNGDEAFRGTQFYANACAMIHAVNVHARRNMRIEVIAYFWMSPIPLFEISRNFEIRFCPYIRKNYFVPIFAPCNDLFWRDFNRWSQLDVQIGVYEYFLGIGTRPWVDVFQYDYPEEAARRLTFSTPESDTRSLPQIEFWTLMRYFWDASADPRELRRRYIRRVYREAAPAMEKFRFTLDNYIWNEIALNYPMEFEDYSQVGIIAMNTPSKTGKGTLIDELNGYLEEARRTVKHPASKEMLDALIANWEEYLAEAKRRNALIPVNK